MKLEFMREAIRLSEENVRNGGGPFGAVIVKNDRIIARGTNCVTAHNDPTAHAEVMAIREACKTLKTFNLQDCEIYSSCEPCPMCLSAVYWARIRKLYFANTKVDAERIGFSDKFIYDELNLEIRERSLPSESILREEAQHAFELWTDKADKIEY